MNKIHLLSGAALALFSVGAHADPIQMQGKLAVQKCATQDHVRVCGLPAFVPLDLKLELQRQDPGSSAGSSDGSETWTGSTQENLDLDDISFVATVEVHKFVNANKITTFSVEGDLAAVQETKTDLGRVSVQSPTLESLSAVTLEGGILDQGNAEYSPSLVFGQVLPPGPVHPALR